MRKRIIIGLVTVKILFVSFIVIPLGWAWHRLRKWERNHPSERPTEPFYE